MTNAADDVDDVVVDDDDDDDDDDDGGLSTGPLTQYSQRYRYNHTWADPQRKRGDGLRLGCGPTARTHVRDRR